MHHIVFDTNVLRNEHFHSPRMKMLKRLIDDGIAKLYIPEIVKNEFLTQKILESHDKLKTRSIIDVNRFFVNDRYSCKDKLSKAEELIKEVAADIEHLVNIEFDDWVSEYKIEILQFNNSKIQEVMDDYFTGGSVFKKIKSRQDIPDAMICTVIEELHSEIGELNVLINDTTFANYLKTIPSINVYSTSGELLENKAIKDDLDMLDKRDARFSLLHNYLSSNIFKKYLEIYLTTKSEVIEDIYVENSTTSNKSILGNYVFYCNIEAVNKSTLSDLNIYNVELADEDEYFLHINFKAMASWSFGTEYIEFLELEETKRDVKLYNLKGDGATVVHEERLSEFDGTLTIYVNETDSKNPEELLNYNSIEIEIEDVNILPI